MKTAKNAALVMVLLAGTAGAQAALVNRGGGMIYDSTLNITWLADMNLARTSGHRGSGVSADGRMTWAAAGLWANNLVFGGYDDWRLPSINPSDTSCSTSANLPGAPVQHYGYGCTGSELTHLFVSDFGNRPGESVRNQSGDTAEQVANLALFSNVAADTYWSSTPSALYPGNAWYFQAAIGVTLWAGLDAPMFAVAVRPGDVAVQQAIPEPQTLALAGLALAAGALARRRRPR